jgi:hypothetical protein
VSPGLVERNLGFEYAMFRGDKTDRLQRPRVRSRLVEPDFIVYEHFRQRPKEVLGALNSPKDCVLTNRRWSGLLTQFPWP